MHHVAAVGEARDPDAITVGDPIPDGPVDRSEQVLGVGVSPGTVERASVLLAVAHGSSCVQSHHVEPGVGQRDIFHHRGRSDGAVRPPVDVEHEWAGAARATGA